MADATDHPVGPGTSDTGGVLLRLKTPLQRMVQVIDEIDAFGDKDAWHELVLLIDLEGILDGLDDQDARGVVAAAVYDLHESGPAALIARSEWIESGEGARPPHDAGAVVTALRRIADLVMAAGL